MVKTKCQDLPMTERSPMFSKGLFRTKGESEYVHATENYLRQLLIIFFIFYKIVCFGQIEILPGTLDYGSTNPETQWVIDVHITNKGPKKDFLLRHTFSHEYDVLFTTKTILPDSSIVMRVKFSPRMKATYREKIELYFASMVVPIILPVNADVDYLNPDDHIACPSFSRLAADCCTNNMFMVEVVDSISGEPIGKAEVKISEYGTQRLKLLTMSDGKVSRTIPIGYYGVEASYPDYLSNGLMCYINHRHAYFKIRLARKIATQEVETEISMDTPTIFFENEVQLMPDEDFFPNNIVYLLDVSSSMLQGDKLALMKGSLLQMSNALRKQDKITLISYAGDARVILATTAGDQHGEIRSLVENLHADGSTSGSSGFKKSYDVLKDDGLLYAKKLLEAGNYVVHRDYAGHIHGFFSYGKYVDEGIAVRDFLSTQINKILAS